jgi:hypothetical protein
VSGQRSEENAVVLRIKYRFIDPNGRSIIGEASRTRSDLGADLSGEPLPETPLLAQYAGIFHRPIDAGGLAHRRGMCVRQRVLNPRD